MNSQNDRPDLSNVFVKEPEFSRDSLRKIAQKQGSLIPCILVYLLAMPGLLFAPGIAAGLPHRVSQAPFVMWVIVSRLIALLTVICAMVFVFSLARWLFRSVGMGVALAILTAIPYAGFFVMMGLNLAANSVLRKAGIKVGFWGARV